MLQWKDIIRFTSQGNPEPDRRVNKTEDEWRDILTPEEFRVTRQKGTERAHSSDMCSLFEPGLYECICCGTLLFDASEKFESGTGWPSFTNPVKENAVAYHKDSSFGMVRVEALCNTCDAHLGHIFPDGPQPSGLRYCINAVSMRKVTSSTAKATFGGGCFWCTEAIFQEITGVEQVLSGYAGGEIKNPTYREVCSGRTGHAEVIQVNYDPNLISYEQLLVVHLTTHNPTTLNKQGADRGTQYRSIIFYQSNEEKKVAERVIERLQSHYDKPIVTELKKLEMFYEAEANHQDYYLSNPQGGYCQAVIDPKLRAFRENYAELIK